MNKMPMLQYKLIQYFKLRTTQKCCAMYRIFLAAAQAHQRRTRKYLNVEYLIIVASVPYSEF